MQNELTAALKWMHKNGSDLRCKNGGPSPYRLGLASKYNASPEDVDAAIAAVWGDAPRIDEEEAAQLQAKAEAEFQRTGGQAAREYDNEDD